MRLRFWIGLGLIGLLICALYVGYGGTAWRSPRRRASPSARLRPLLVRAAANAVFLVTSLSVLAVARPVIMARRARRRWGQ